MEPARVSSPQVDLTRCGLDKTPTLLVLQCPGATRSAEGEEVHSWEEEEEEGEGGELLIKDLKRTARDEEEEELFNHCKERPREARAYPVG